MVELYTFKRAIKKISDCWKSRKMIKKFRKTVSDAKALEAASGKGKKGKGKGKRNGRR